jgi:MFS family permease
VEVEVELFGEEGNSVADNNHESRNGNLSLSVAGNHDESNSDDLSRREATALERGPISGSNVRTPKDYTTWEMLQTSDYYMFLVILVGTMGTGTMVSNNMAQIVQADGGGENDSGVFVSLFSIANCVGRMAVGLCSDLYKDTVTRPVFLVIASGTMSFAALLLAMTGLRTLYIGVFLVGSAHGCLWNLMPSIVSDLFGLKHFGGNYSGLRWCPALGSLLISTLLAGKVCLHVPFVACTLASFFSLPSCRTIRRTCPSSSSFCAP